MAYSQPGLALERHHDPLDPLADAASRPARRFRRATDGRNLCYACFSARGCTPGACTARGLRAVGRFAKGEPMGLVGKILITSAIVLGIVAIAARTDFAPKLGLQKVV